MPRKPREISPTGVYHIMFRGINKQLLFEDQEDYKKFLSILKAVKANSACKLYAYCLMGNHVHLLIQDEADEIGLLMKRIGISYARYYNEKYERNGHLFQDRFRSENIESEKYLLTVLRYIHQNPQKAGLAQKVWEYPWSSYQDYEKKSPFLDIEFVLNFFSSDKNHAWERFRIFHQDVEEVDCLEIAERKGLSDQMALQLILEISNTAHPGELANFEAKKRNALLSKMRREGISTRQIQRLTGISRGTILKA